MHKPLIAAHRGASGGNIPCNSWVAYEAALAMGADVVEIDVARSADGHLFVFHPGMEKPHLLSDRPIAQMTAQEVRALRYVNMDDVPTELGVSTLDDVLEQLKNRCIINIDKFPTCMREIAQTVRRHGMQEQVLVKSSAKEAHFREVEEVAPDLPYMAILWNEDHVSESLCKRLPRYQGTEALFATEACEVSRPEYVQRMHRLGLRVWANAIVYDYKVVLSAGHNDDISVAGQPERGWGWLAGVYGADIIQTDWPGMMKQYLDNRQA